jgi:F0F1-type ATP synthase delta subunit
MHDNKLRKICFPYPYKLENNNKSKILWIIINKEMKQFLSNYKINSNSKKKAISEYFIDKPISVNLNLYININ